MILSGVSLEDEQERQENVASSFTHQSVRLRRSDSIHGEAGQNGCCQSKVMG